jgi:hypothetical protein
MPAARLPLRIVVRSPPAGVRFSLQDKTGAPVDAVTADGSDLAFDLVITLTETPAGLRPGGPFVRSDARGRFVYVASGTLAGDAASCWTRRAKIYLGDLPDEMARAAAKAGRPLEAVIAGAARDGGPPAATVPLIQPWR